MFPINIAHSDPYVRQVQVATLCISISLSATVTLVCLFSPKLYILAFHPEKNVRRLTMNLNNTSRSYLLTAQIFSALNESKTVGCMGENNLEIKTLKSSHSEEKISVSANLLPLSRHTSQETESLREYISAQKLSLANSVETGHSASTIEKAEIENGIRVRQDKESIRMSDLPIYAKPDYTNEARGMTPLPSVMDKQVDSPILSISIQACTACRPEFGSLSDSPWPTAKDKATAKISKYVEHKRWIPQRKGLEAYGEGGKKSNSNHAVSKGDTNSITNTDNEYKTRDLQQGTVTEAPDLTLQLKWQNLCKNIYSFRPPEPPSLVYDNPSVGGVSQAYASEEENWLENEYEAIKNETRANAQSSDSYKYNMSMCKLNEEFSDLSKPNVKNHIARSWQ
ncbi:unnamed protein product [Protopolystoma xenopodis]|uniref:G-protein coupled receptors family 3 profile domain-containing protein n=1 Tax=Protopolystoma xenopodis TaxID=117903 RepID=A0A448XMS2_9PLAT|nr:unnamed protein product [Protopolystoma xenopodis]